MPLVSTAVVPLGNNRLSLPKNDVSPVMVLPPMVPVIAVT